jgi:DNA-binding LacI/PurR family transcriptional regulator
MWVRRRINQDHVYLVESRKTQSIVREKTRKRAILRVAERHNLSPSRFRARLVRKREIIVFL